MLSGKDDTRPAYARRKSSSGHFLAQLVNRMYAVFIAAVRQAFGYAGAASPMRRDRRR